MVLGAAMSTPGNVNAQGVGTPQVLNASVRLPFPQCHHQQPFLYNETTWHLIRKAYDRFRIGSTSYGEQTRKGVFHVPYEVRLNVSNRQRGIFTTALIQRGALIWSSDFSVLFKGRRDFFSFLYLLSRDLACDMIRFAYLVKEHNHDYVGLDLDDGSFFNSNRAESNCGCRHPDEMQKGIKGCSASVYSQRDIAAHEELFEDYANYHKGRSRLVWFSDLNLRVEREWRQHWQRRESSQASWPTTTQSHWKTSQSRKQLPGAVNNFPEPLENFPEP